MCGGGQQQPFGQQSAGSQPFGQMPRGMSSYMPQSNFRLSSPNGAENFPALPQGTQTGGPTNWPALPQQPKTGGLQQTPPWMQQFQPIMDQFMGQQQPQNGDPRAAERARLGMAPYAGAAYGGPQMAKNHGGVGPPPGPTLPPPPGPGQPPPPQPGGGQPPWQSPENTYLSGPTAGFLGMSGPPKDPRMMWHQQSGQYQLVPGYNGYTGSSNPFAR